MEKPYVLLSLLTDANDFQREQANAAKDTASRAGVDIQVVYANSDPITQSEQLLQVIQNADVKPRGILVQPAGGTALPQVARAAVMAGIGWVLLNREADYIPELRKGRAVPVFAVSSDQKEIGRIQGRQFGALLPNGGTVLYLQGPSSSAAAHQRSDGMNETRPANVQVRTLKSASWTTEDGRKAIASWLRLSTAHKEQIDLVAAQGDMLAMGARQELHEQANSLERPEWIRARFTGVDGLPRGGRSWVESGILAATVVVPPNAGDALAMLVKSLETGTQPPEATYTAPASWPSIEALNRAHVLSVPRSR